jgi:copper(I)-binding protein
MKKTLLILVLSLTSAFACTQKLGTIELSNKTFRALKGAVNGSAYLTITQMGDTSDKLISARCGASERMEIHDHIVDPSTKAKKMVEIKSIDIPSKKDGCWLFTCWFAKPKPVEFVKGGKHLMLMGLKPGSSELKDIEIKLVFEKAGEVSAKFKAESVDGKADTVCEHHKH